VAQRTQRRLRKGVEEAELLSSQLDIEGLLTDESY
jgi:hypothetical protein